MDFTKKITTRNRNIAIFKNNLSEWGEGRRGGWEGGERGGGGGGEGGEGGGRGGGGAFAILEICAARFIGNKSSKSSQPPPLRHDADRAFTPYQGTSVNSARQKSLAKVSERVISHCSTKRQLHLEWYCDRSRMWKL